MGRIPEPLRDLLKHFPQVSREGAQSALSHAKLIAGVQGGLVRSVRTAVVSGLFS